MVCLRIFQASKKDGKSETPKKVKKKKKKGKKERKKYPRARDVFGRLSGSCVAGFLLYFFLRNVSSEWRERTIVELDAGHHWGMVLTAYRVECL